MARSERLLQLLYWVVMYIKCPIFERKKLKILKQHTKYFSFKKRNLIKSNFIQRKITISEIHHWKPTHKQEYSSYKSTVLSIKIVSISNIQLNEVNCSGRSSFVEFRRNVWLMTILFHSHSFFLQYILDHLCAKE